MHVGQLNTNLTWGGGEYQVLQIARGAQAQGMACTLFATEGGLLADRARAEGLTVVTLPKGASVRETARRVAAAGCNALHAHDSGSLALGGAVAARLGLPLVYTRRVASPLRRNLFSRRKYGPGRIARVVAISRETVKRVFLDTGAFPPERVRVVPSGVDLDALANVAPDSELRAFAGDGYLAGGVGKLSAKKNWGFLVKVAAAIQQGRLADVRWVVAGEGEERVRLEREIRQLGLADRVRLLGFRRDNLRVLKSLDLLFFPSTVEGAGVTVMEAMGLGLPVVAVHSDGVAETLGGCGRLVLDGDVDGAAHTVGELLGDADARARLRDAACSRARHVYDIHGTVAGNLAVYCELAREV